MAKLINNERGARTLPSGHVIPRNGELICTNDTILSNWAVLSGPIMAGQIIAEYDPEPTDEPAPKPKRAKAD